MVYKQGPSKNIWHFINLVILLFFGCCTPFPRMSTTPIAEREDGTVLIIGCIVLPPTVIGYRLKTVYVELAYQPPGEEDNPAELITVKTDSAGYFTLANMPIGKYSIARVIEGEMDSYMYSYSERSMDWSYYFFTGPYIHGRTTRWTKWHEIDEGGIYNFNYLTLTDKPGEDYTYLGDYYKSLEPRQGSYIYSNQKYYKYYRHSVPQYFLDKYPDSEWAPYLQRLVDKPQ